MPTLILATWKMPGAKALASAARRLGWSVVGLNRNPSPKVEGTAILYGGSELCDQMAARMGVKLIEPAFDLLARTPRSLLLRSVDSTQYCDLRPFPTPTFVKPADVRRKAFDAGIYSDVRNARLEAPLDPEMPVLVSEAVEWLEEYRCFLLDGKIVTWSPYLWFGRPSWKPYSGGQASLPPAPVQDVCRRLLATPRLPFPDAFVVDVGLIENRGWAVVEYNPAWCSSLLGADPRRVLPVIARASQTVEVKTPRREHQSARKRRERDALVANAHRGYGCFPNAAVLA